MSITKSCKLLGYTKQAFYDAKNKDEKRAIKNAEIEAYVLEKVRAIRKRLKKCGGHKMYKMISKDPNRNKYKFGIERFFAILRKHNLLIKRRKKRIVTTDSSNWRKQYPNLVKGIIPHRPEQIVVSDITYFKTEEGPIYGHLITDAYSKKIMGYAIADNMKATTTLRALKMAVRNRRNKEPMIHHSDRGMQYLSKIYTDYLKDNKIAISVTQDGNPGDNPIAERINGILKGEFGFDGVFKNLKEAKEHMAQAVKDYNGFRPHMSCHDLTPNQMHRQRKLLVITWKKNVQQNLECSPTGHNLDVPLLAANGEV